MSMEWNLNARSEWDWEIEIPKSLAISSQENGDYSSISGFLDSLSKHRGRFSDKMDESSTSVLSGEAMIGLKPGRQTTNCQEKPFPCVSESSCSPILKRSRASYHSSHLPRCQVEGCNLDLALAKDYHRRHRICADHSKSPKVVVAGLERRFCQQCSRLHDLSEFDDKKRSCRRRLSAHNARRRRPQPEDIKFSSTHPRPHMSFLVNQISTRSPDSTPQSSSKFKGGCVINMMSNGGLSDISSSLQEVTPKNGLEANSSLIYAMEVRQSFSLEATSSWGFNGHDEPSSFDQFTHGHNIGSTQPAGVPLGMQSICNTQILPQDFGCLTSD